jgi:hypothetical protein
VHRDDWFRSPEWGAEARAAFEQRLARARPRSRPQYRRIKGLALLETGDPERQAAGRQLLEAVIADPDAYQFERVGALCFLAAHEQDTNRLDAAEQHLRAAIPLLGTRGSGGTGLEEVRLAEILLTRGGGAELAEARGLVDRADAGPFPSSQFRRCLAGVRIALAMGDQPGAEAWARRALELAARTHSGLANHPRLGLVDADEATMAWLASFVASAKKAHGGGLGPEERAS